MVGGRKTERAGSVPLNQAPGHRAQGYARAGTVDNFLARVLEVIFGRFFITHRPWRWRPGAFFGGRGALGKMG